MRYKHRSPEWKLADRKCPVCSESLFELEQHKAGVVLVLAHRCDTCGVVTAYAPMEVPGYQIVRRY